MDAGGGVADGETVGGGVVAAAAASVTSNGMTLSNIACMVVGVATSVDGISAVMLRRVLIVRRAASLCAASSRRRRRGSIGAGGVAKTNIGMNGRQRSTRLRRAAAARNAAYLIISCPLSSLWRHRADIASAGVVSHRRAVSVRWWRGRIRIVALRYGSRVAARIETISAAYVGG